MSAKPSAIHKADKKLVEKLTIYFSLYGWSWSVRRIHGRYNPLVCGMNRSKSKEIRFEVSDLKIESMYAEDDYMPLINRIKATLKEFNSARA